MEYRKRKVDLVDTTTGEVIASNVLTKQEMDMAYIGKAKPKTTEMYQKRDELISFLAENQGIFIHMIYTYGKPIFQEIIDDVGQAKANTAIVRLMILTTYLNFNNNLYDKNNNRIKKSSLAKIWNTSNRRSVNETYEILTKHNYISEEGGYIMINNDKFIKGEVANYKKLKENDPSLTYVRVFIESLRELYNEAEPKKRQQLAQFFKILPFVHYEYNILCHNPLEEDADKLERMSWTELAEICGLSPESKHVTRLKKDLSFRLNGQYVVGEFKESPSSKIVKIVINPALYYAGSDISKLIGVIKLFEAGRK